MQRSPFDMQCCCCCVVTFLQRPEQQQQQQQQQQLDSMPRPLLERHFYCCQGVSNPHKGWLGGGMKYKFYGGTRYGYCHTFRHIFGCSLNCWMIDPIQVAAEAKLDIVRSLPRGLQSSQGEGWPRREIYIFYDFRHYPDLG